MYNIFSISIGDVLQKSGFKVPSEYFIYGKELYFVNSCISEKFIENVLDLEFSEFINCTFKEYFEKSDSFDCKIQKINDALLKHENRLKTIDEISKKLNAYFDEYDDYLLFPPEKTDYLYYKMYFRRDNMWLSMYINKEDFQFAEEKIRNCTILKLFNDDEYLLLKILKNTLNGKTTFDKQDLHRIRQITNSLEVQLDFRNSTV